MRPSPNTPTVLPSSKVPVTAGQSSSRMRKLTCGIFRTKDKIKPMVSSLVAAPLSLGVLEITMPRLVALARSRCTLVRPVCEMNFNFGSWLYSLSLKNVRSRMSSSASNSRKRWTIFSLESSRSRKSVISARALSLA